MKLEVWSDVVCPWCYVGKRNLELALEGFEHRDQVDVVYRSYELDPGAPPEREGTYEERLSRKYGVPVGQARAMIARIVDAGAQVGLDFRFDLARAGNTFDAHRLIKLGGEPVKERLMRAYFTEGEPIGDRETLVRLAVDAGLDEGEVRAVLDSDRYADAVRADEKAGVEHDITGVPFFAIDGKYGVAGAQPPEILRRVLERRWAEARPPEVA